MVNETKLVPRVAETLRLIQELRNPSRAELAARLGCSPNTVSQYTTELRLAGLIYPSGTGRFARWSCTTAPSPPPVKMPPVKALVATPLRLLEQVNSVWHYARRCAAYAKERR